jgi:hypothetical protein
LALSGGLNVSTTAPHIPQLADQLERIYPGARCGAVKQASMFMEGWPILAGLLPVGSDDLAWRLFLEFMFRPLCSSGEPVRKITLGRKARSPELLSD